MAETLTISSEMISAGVAAFEDLNEAYPTDLLVAAVYKTMWLAGHSDHSHATEQTAPCAG